jgi:beta-RFAP synthase
MSRLTFRPYRSSQTYRNLKAHGQGVFHVTDDVELLARAALGDVQAELRPARSVKGYMLAGACRAYEFQVTSIDDREDRTTIEVQVVRAECLREFFGFNRAKHAVVEAAILATRTEFLPIAPIREKLAELSTLVQKTGGPAELRAFEFLHRHVESAAQKTTAAATVTAGAARVRLVTGSRLHFGLLAAGAGKGRRFGGAGVMVARPGIELSVERSAAPGATGLLSDRVLELARKCTGEPSPPYRIRVHGAPREHVGLGTGTQLAMAVARGIAHLRQETASLPDLAHRVGRGRRSGVGVHGFEQGGFLVDAGKGNGGSLAPVAVRAEVPESWRFVLALPRQESGISGPMEEDAFLRLMEVPEEVVGRLCHTLLLGLVPAMLEADLPSFGEALDEYGTLAGEVFQKVQGGIFGSPRATLLIEFLRKEGIRGAGQTSWGPTVYAVVEGSDQAKHLRERIEKRFGSSALEVIISEPMNTGARLENLAEIPEE